MRQRRIAIRLKSVTDRILTRASTEYNAASTSYSPHVFERVKDRGGLTLLALSKKLVPLAISTSAFCTKSRVLIRFLCGPLRISAASVEMTVKTQRKQR